jgi:ribonuclease P protein component
VTSREFGKPRRLRRRGEFQQVFDGGQRMRGRFLTLLMTPRPVAGARLGIVASKKLGNSVRRNRAKRLIREMFRQNIELLGQAGFDIIVIPRAELFDAPYAGLEDDYRTALTRCAARLKKHGR